MRRSAKATTRSLSFGAAIAIHGLALYAIFGAASKSSFSLLSNDSHGAMAVVLVGQSSLKAPSAAPSDGDSAPAAPDQQEAAQAAAPVDRSAQPQEDSAIAGSTGAKADRSDHSARLDDYGASQAALSADTAIPAARSGDPAPPKPPPRVNPWSQASVFLANQHGPEFSIWPQVSRCWRPPAADVSVVLDVRIDGQGAVAGTPSLADAPDAPQPPDTPAQRAAQAAAAQAVLACAPYAVPIGSANTYELVFDGGYGR